MIGDNTDMWGRLKNLLPVGWFGDNNPIRDALLWGYANTLAWGYTLYLYAKDQTRIKSATDGWLDLIGLDFFGNNLVRYSSQTDASYRNRILINIFRERTTRHAMEQVLYDLTGRWPIIIEPARPADVGSYGAAVAVSRVSTGTYFDLNGRMVTADVNVARWDTDLTTGLGRLLIEEARTNLAIQSNSASTIQNLTRAAYIATTQLFVDGIGLLRLLREDTTASNTHFGTPAAVAVVASQMYTASYFVKAAGRTKFRLDCVNTGSWSPSGPTVTYDLAALTAVGINGASGTISPLSDGVFRITCTARTGAAGFSTSMYPILLDAIGNASYTGDGVSGIYIGGYQLEAGGYATSYIPTAGSPVTRAADILLNNMPAGSIAIGGYGVAGSYGSVLLPYQAFITAFRPLGQGLPFVSGYGISTGAYSTPSRSAYGQLSGGDVTDADIYAAIDATKPIGTVAWTRISS